MINITWGNLMPPRCSQAYIVNFLLAPSFFNNPDLGKSIQESSFYQRKDGTILDALNNVKAFRSRLFNFGDSPKTSEKLINLLLLKTKQDNIAYTFFLSFLSDVICLFSFSSTFAKIIQTQARMDKVDRRSKNKLSSLEISELFRSSRKGDLL